MSSNNDPCLVAFPTQQSLNRRSSSAPFLPTKKGDNRGGSVSRRVDPLLRSEEHHRALRQGIYPPLNTNLTARMCVPESPRLPRTTITTTPTALDDSDSFLLQPSLNDGGSSNDKKNRPSRRSIFGNTAAHYSTYSRRPRSASEPIAEEVPCTPNFGHRELQSDSIRSLDSAGGPESSLSYISPPKEEVESLNRHFRHIEELPAQLNHVLPTIPTPLQRFYHDDGKLRCLSGAYPLDINPPSILRQTSYGSSNGNNKTANDFESVVTAKSFLVNHGSFKLLDAPRPPPVKQASDDEPGREDCSTRSSSISSNSSSRLGRCVQFDPRITVTEINEQFERDWFNEADLDRFKAETCLVAQKFLMKHPHLIETYNKPILDPITRTMRKRALFSLPVLSHVDGDDEAFERSLQKSSSSSSSPPLPGDEVAQILIADRNTLILDLFRRSLQNLFPYAKITIVQTAEEALRSFTELKLSDSARSFDIVIAEERLHCPLAPLARKAVGAGSQLSATTRLPPDGTGEDRLTCITKEKQQQQQTPGHARSCSDVGVVNEVGAHHSRSCSDMQFIHKERAISGSQLFARINQLSGSKWRPLLIGVSTQPQTERHAFLEGGADFVWGKPPPSMNQALGFELVSSLVQKRGRTMK